MPRNTIFPRSLRYLLAVAKHSSFTRAAESLFVSQPALSQQIKQLEAQIGIQLLERSGRNVHLTDAGEIYVHHVKRALAEINAAAQALDDLSDLTRGSLSLGLTPITDYLTAPLIRDFITKYPRISLNTIEMTQQQIEEAVLQDQVNLGVIFSDSFSLSTRSADLEIYTLLTDSLVLAAASSAHLTTNANECLYLEEVGLVRHPLALLNSQFEMRKQIDAYFSYHEITPNVTLESNSLGVIIEVVRSGELHTILPASIVKSLGGLTPLTVSPPLPQHTVTIIIRKSAYQSQACSAFLKLALLWSQVPRGVLSAENKAHG
jgi:LysR family cyn operon transcriptional activator